MKSPDPEKRFDPEAVNQAPGGDETELHQGQAQAEPAVQELQEQLAQSRAQAAEYLDNWRRTAAEFSNARKRMQREQAEFASAASARLLEKLLPIIDDVDRAFSAVPADEAGNEWLEGFRLIQRKLYNLLESEGVTAIPAEGQKFQPEVHYAVTHEHQPGFSDGDVIAEVNRGYKLGDRVLRPSMVRVAKGNE